jgi:hypothetical protein
MGYQPGKGRRELQRKGKRKVKIFMVHLLQLKVLLRHPRGI